MGIKIAGQGELRLASECWKKAEGKDAVTLIVAREGSETG